MTSDALVARREDELAIRDLAFRYARMVDRRDWTQVSRVFTPDCVLSGTGFRMRGHVELDAGLRKIDMFSATQHCVLNQVTQLDGDRGTGEFYCVAYHIHESDGVPYKLDMGIRYEDRYVRTAEGWRLAERTLHLIWQQDLPLDLSIAALTEPAGAVRAASGKASRPKSKPASSKRVAKGRAARLKKKPARKRSAR